MVHGPWYVHMYVLEYQMVRTRVYPGINGTIGTYMCTWYYTCTNISKTYVLEYHGTYHGTYTCTYVRTRYLSFVWYVYTYTYHGTRSTYHGTTGTMVHLYYVRTYHTGTGGGRPTPRSKRRSTPTKTTSSRLSWRQVDVSTKRPVTGSTL